VKKVKLFKEMDARAFSDIMVVPYSGRYTEISKLLFDT
jgi:hypothetical protein